MYIYFFLELSSAADKNPQDDTNSAEPIEFEELIILGKITDEVRNPFMIRRFLPFL